MPRKQSLFSRMGGKFSMRRYIVRQFPDHYSTYIEPFVGSGQVFMELPKLADCQYILNDLDLDIYHIWKDLQSVPHDTIRLYDFTGDKTRFNALKLETDLPPEDRLFRNLYLSYYSFSGLRNKYASKPYKKGNNLLLHIDYFKDKMENVIVLNQDYKAVIQQYDHTDAILYLDPPYTNMEKYYGGMSIDPLELANVCRNIRGKFVLSYDASQQVKDAFDGFVFHNISVPYTSGLKNKIGDELLITNYT